MTWQPRALLHRLVMAWLDRRGFAAVRRELGAQARGRVLEIGAGDGANARWLTAADQVVLSEPDPALAARIPARAARAGVSATAVAAAAENLPFPDAHFDTVLFTLVVCSVDDPARALAEVHRVLRPGGLLLFAEHVRASEPRLGARQDRLSGAWQRCCGGCHPNRDTVAAIESAGFTVRTLRHGRLAGAPSLVRPLVVGTAIRSDTP